MSATRAGNPTSLVLVDDSNVVSDGVRALIELQTALVVLAGPSEPGRAVTLNVVPDVVIADIDSSPDGPGLVGRLREAFADASILVLTLVDDPGVVRTAFAAGAAGYVLKSAETAEFLEAVETVARGEHYLQPALGIAIARERGTGRSNADALLSQNETDILRLLVRGHTNQEIATLRGVSLRTIETQRANILRQLGLRTRAELVRYAREHGVIGSDV
jgi:DNA-binding NarL/FixJ family response regulator